MPSPLLLFIAEGCRFSRELMNDYGECLTRISDRIFYFDVKDTNVKRKRVTQSAIEYHRIKQFPSLVCENGTILQSSASIASAIQELCQIAPHPQFTNLKEDNGPGGSGPHSSLKHHSASSDLSHIGSWPSADQVSGADPRQQQQPPPYAQQQQGGYPPQQQGYTQQQHGQQQAYYPQQNQQQQGVVGYDPHVDDVQQGGGFHGIGAGGLIGAGETNMAQNGAGNNADTADIGNWPTNKKINNMNVMGGGGSGNGFNGGGDSHDRAQQMYQQKGQMNQQQTGMMMNNYGQPAANAYPMY